MPVTVTVKIFAYSAGYDGPQEFSVELPEDINKAVDHLLTGSCAAFRKDLGTVSHLLINGRNYQLNKAENIKLHDGDVLSFVSMLSGG